MHWLIERKLVSVTILPLGSFQRFGMRRRRLNGGQAIGKK